MLMFASVLILKSWSHTSKMKKLTKKNCLLKGCPLGVRGYLEKLHYLLKSFFHVILVISYMFASHTYRVEEPEGILLYLKNQMKDN